jgi:hypothetical protein
MATSSTNGLSRTTGEDCGADAVTCMNAGRLVGSVGRIDAKNRPDVTSLIIVVEGIPTPDAVKVASPEDRAKTLIFAFAESFLE